PSVNTLVVCSGGLDSVTLAHKVAVEQRLIHLVSFDYGQRHRGKELEFARACAARLGVAHDVVDITDIGFPIVGHGSSRPSPRFSAPRSTAWRQLPLQRRSCARARPTSCARARGSVYRLPKRGPATGVARAIAAAAAPASSGAKPSILQASTIPRRTRMPTIG